MSEHGNRTELQMELKINRNQDLFRTQKSNRVDLSKSLQSNKLTKTLQHSYIQAARRKVLQGTNVVTEVQRLINMIVYEGYMQYKDYQDVKKFYDNNANTLFNPPTNEDFYHLCLVAVKAYFLDGQYQQCFDIITSRLRSVTPVPKFKFLYERQMIFLCVVYFLNLGISYLQLSANQFAKNRYKCLDQQGRTIDQLKPYVRIYQNYIVTLGSIVNTYFKNAERRKQTKLDCQENGENQETEKSVLQNLNELEKMLLRKCQVFQGIPYYFLSKIYKQKVLNFIKISKQSGRLHEPIPGPPLNLELMNHLYEFQPVDSSTYMNSLLYPVTYGINYDIIDRATWKTLNEIFGKATPVIRYPTCDNFYSNLTHNDFTTHIYIDFMGTNYCLQLEQGSLWQTVLRKISNDTFDTFGQLKCTSLVNQSVEDFIVGEGVVGKCKVLYRFIEINGFIDFNPNLTSKRVNKLIKKYDFQSYVGIDLLHKDNHDFNKNMVVLVQNDLYKDFVDAIGEYQWTQTISQRILTNYCTILSKSLNNALKCLAGIPDLVEFYVYNKFIPLLNSYFKAYDKQYDLECFERMPIEITFSFQHLLKKMWFGHKKCLKVDPKIFTECFIRQKIRRYYLQKDKTISELIQQDLQQISQASILHEILYSLHNDICSPASNPCTKKDKFNIIQSPSLINSMLCLQIHQSIACTKCRQVMWEKKYARSYLEVGVGGGGATIDFWILCGEGVTPAEDTEKQVSQNEQRKDKGWRAVREAVFARGGGKKLLDIYKDLANAFRVDGGGKGYCFFTVIMNSSVQVWMEIGQPVPYTYFFNSQGSYENPSISSIHQQMQKLKQTVSSKNKKITMCIYLIPEPKPKQQTFLVIFRNEPSGKNIAFPQLISMKTPKKSEKQKLSQNLLHKGTKVDDFKIKQNKKCNKSFINSTLTIYTNSSVSNFIHPNKIVFGKLEKQKIVKLEELLGKILDQNQQQSDIHAHGQIFGREKSLQQCKKCKAHTIQKETVLVQLPDVLILSIKQKDKNSPTPLEFPLCCPMRGHPYRLRVAILKQLQVQGQVHRGVPIVINGVDEQWYAGLGENVVRLDQEDFINQQIQLLIYFKDVNKRKQTFSDKSSNK